MSMKITKAIQKASDARLRDAIKAGDTKSISTRTNKQRSQVFRGGMGKGGRGQS